VRLRRSAGADDGLVAERFEDGAAFWLRMVWADFSFDVQARRFEPRRSLRLV
jgi:hypothetical protein